MKFIVNCNHSRRIEVTSVIWIQFIESQSHCVELLQNWKEQKQGVNVFWTFCNAWVKIKTM